MPTLRGGRPWKSAWVDSCGMRGEPAQQICTAGSGNVGEHIKTAPTALCHKRSSTGTQDQETGGRIRALEGLTEPFSITRLSMTTPLLFCSHTISQKWPHVLGRGPCKQSTKGKHLNSSQVISTTSWTPPQSADRAHYQVLRGLFHNSAWHRADQ